ncbi:hypothetical protein LEP1GSC133_2134 [Leptospira borgpetersenii serovar Pomona str. 200901868]|uniref:Uncharacterized protein n=2 Tax=Leptospira borgpetersenii TaxID=174 RepID=M3GAA9_LEPBO|nr:hypothetical protein LEP1GSC123_4223 [Leptospira borgpetersenii str. 200701203]EMO11693.1 hypothetical protein LEP1GSC137_3245 [Leptospira borgpetersenii str. Noumea 25]EMO63208.1 hypothetical protein LEP1GSC133_2134 [Leptospira borgpetersenii serovar Pomona str. 200901868]
MFILPLKRMDRMSFFDFWKVSSRINSSLIRLSKAIHRG